MMEDSHNCHMNGGRVGTMENIAQVCCEGEVKVEPYREGGSKAAGGGCSDIQLESQLKRERQEKLEMD